MKKIKILFIITLLCIPSIVKAEAPIQKSFLFLEDNRIITEITDKKVTDNSYLVCKEDNYIPYQIVRVVRSAITLIKYVVPILLIIMGMLDFGKVVLGKPDEQMKKSKQAFLSRLITAVLVFLVVNIVEMVIRIVSTTDENLNCLKCFVEEKDCKYVDITYPETPSPTPKQTQTPSPTSKPKQTPSPTPKQTPSPQNEESQEQTSTQKPQEVVSPTPTIIPNS